MCCAVPCIVERAEPIVGGGGGGVTFGASAID